MTNWQTATLISKKQMALDITTLTYSIPQWTPHKAGQHYEIRLISKNGHEAIRDYSVASAPEEKGIVEFGVQLLQDGEVSPRLVNRAVGDAIEMRGPMGGHFVWESTFSEPLILIAGGSGIMPTISILRHYMKGSRGQDVTVIVSAKTAGHVACADELASYTKENPRFTLHTTLTRETPEGWKGHTGRLNEALLKKLITVRKMPRIYISGPTPFVESVSKDLVTIGFSPGIIRTERFGGTRYE